MSGLEWGFAAGCTFMVVWHFGSNFVMGLIEAHREAQAGTRRARRSRVFRKAMHHE